MAPRSRAGHRGNHGETFTGTGPHLRCLTTCGSERGRTSNRPGKNRVLILLSFESKRGRAAAAPARHLHGVAAGFEPASPSRVPQPNRTASSWASAKRAHQLRKRDMVRGEGFEPSSTGSEPGVLPLDEPRVIASSQAARVVIVDYSVVSGGSVGNRTPAVAVTRDLQSRPEPCRSALPETKKGASVSLRGALDGSYCWVASISGCRGPP
jgi:hypothetical protein